MPTKEIGWVEIESVSKGTLQERKWAVSLLASRILEFQNTGLQKSHPVLHSIFLPPQVLTGLHSLGESSGNAPLLQGSPFWGATWSPASFVELVLWPITWRLTFPRPQTEHRALPTPGGSIDILAYVRDLSSSFSEPVSLPYVISWSFHNLLKILTLLK